MLSSIANKFIFNKNNVYNTSYRLYKYNDEYCRLVKLKYKKEKGFEELHKEKTIKEEYEDEVRRCSLSRTKRNIREIALSNDFEYFATITVASEKADRFNLDECQEKLRKIFKKLKRKNKNFAYIFITEKHKDGAFHFHGLVRGLEDFYINNNNYLSHSAFDALGFNSFSKIKSYIKCCNYITKYITKDCVRNSRGTVYISSRHLKKADVYEYKDINFDDYSFNNDFVSIKDFYIKDIPRALLLQLIDEKNA